MTAAVPAPVLEMHGIHKTFAGTHALRNVSFTAYAAEVHALVGENGAGKSTLMKILGGACRPDAGGEIRVDGRAIRVDSPAIARMHGIAVIHQEFALAPNLSVAENVYLGCEPARGALVDRVAMRRGCAALLQRLGAKFGPEARVSGLSVAERQLVEIARAVRARSRILVMDEPTTALSEYETARLFALIEELRAGGLAIIYISHRMEEIHALANRVTVLRDGACVGTLGRAELRPDALVRMMVGRDLSGFHRRTQPGTRDADVVLDVRHVGDGVRVRDCSFGLHAGEVLAVAGMVGAGRTELARMIYGACRRTGGEVRVQGHAVPGRGPAAAIAAGIVYLTEDRKADGLFLDMTLADNINLGVMAGDARGPGVLDRLRGGERAAAAVRAFSIRASGTGSLAGSLSGGNQQKVLLARLLETRPRVLILDEPTRGVDIGSKYEIYQLIDALARTGVGILVISSELPEVVSVADRVLVMRRGAIVGELRGADITQERIVALAVAAEPADAAEHAS